MTHSDLVCHVSTGLVMNDYEDSPSTGTVDTLESTRELERLGEKEVRRSIFIIENGKG